MAIQQKVFHIKLLMMIDDLRLFTFFLSLELINDIIRCEICMNKHKNVLAKRKMKCLAFQSSMPYKYKETIYGCLSSDRKEHTKNDCNVKEVWLTTFKLCHCVSNKFLKIIKLFCFPITDSITYYPRGVVDAVLLCQRKL